MTATDIDELAAPEVPAGDDLGATSVSRDDHAINKAATTTSTAAIEEDGLQTAPDAVGQKLEAAAKNMDEVTKMAAKMVADAETTVAKVIKEAEETIVKASAGVTAATIDPVSACTPAKAVAVQKVAEATKATESIKEKLNKVVKQKETLKVPTVVASCPPPPTRTATLPDVCVGTFMDQRSGARVDAVCWKTPKGECPAYFTRARCARLS